MEYVQGDKIDDLETLKTKYGSPKAATDILIDIFAKMIFIHGHVHCDAHPGNILVRPNPSKPGRP
jgi:aarF domain-containing kinase